MKISPTAVAAITLGILALSASLPESSSAYSLSRFRSQLINGYSTGVPGLTIQRPGNPGNTGPYGLALRQVNLAVSKTYLGPVSTATGSAQVFQVTVTNSGALIAESVYVYDQLPNGWTLDPVTSPGCLGVTTAFCRIPMLQAGKSMNLRIGMKPTSGQATCGAQVTNIAWAVPLAPDPNMLNNTASITTALRCDSPITPASVSSLSISSRSSSSRVAICGNGIREGSEQCDDGNKESGDRCSNTCTWQWNDSRSSVSSSRSSSSRTGGGPDDNTNSYWCNGAWSRVPCNSSAASSAQNSSFQGGFEPDLVATVSATGSRVAGQPLTLNARVDNAGRFPAQNVMLEIKLDGPAWNREQVMRILAQPAYRERSICQITDDGKLQCLLHFMTASDFFALSLPLATRSDQCGTTMSARMQVSTTSYESKKENNVASTSLTLSACQ